MTLPDPIADEAGYWDARLRSPNCTDSDRARFAEWRDADPRNRAAFERLQTLFMTLRHNRSRPDVRALRDAALSAPERPSHRPAVLVAAMLAVLAVGATAWITVPDGGRAAWIARPGEVGVYETGTGQRSTSTLQDGSVVDLNARTRIRVTFTDHARTVELIY